jgi:hypothetical protein
VIWGTGGVPYACVLKKLAGVEDEWELNEGVPRAHSWGEHAVYRMDAERPYDMILTDNPANVDGLIVVSRRLKDSLAAWNVQKVEFLRITILNHKGRIASGDHFILHAIEPVDALDQGQSAASWSALDPSSIDSVERLVLDEGRLDPSRLIFRLQWFPDVLLVRRDLVRALDRGGFSGLRWIELEDYPEV